MNSSNWQQLFFFYLNSNLENFLRKPLCCKKLQIFTFAKKNTVVLCCTTKEVF